MKLQDSDKFSYPVSKLFIALLTLDKKNILEKNESEQPIKRTLFSSIARYTNCV